LEGHPDGAGFGASLGNCVGAFDGDCDGSGVESVGDGSDDGRAVGFRITGVRSSVVEE